MAHLYKRRRCGMLIAARALPSLAARAALVATMHAITTAPPQPAGAKQRALCSRIAACAEMARSIYCPNTLILLSLLSVRLGQKSASGSRGLHLPSSGPLKFTPPSIIATTREDVDAPVSSACTCHCSGRCSCWGIQCAPSSRAPRGSNHMRNNDSDIIQLAAKMLQQAQCKLIWQKN